jgi:tetratricopeptide (TPR) repeat protein
MSRYWSALICCSVFFLATISAAEPPTKEQIAQWISDLASDTFTVRDKASLELYKAGRAAEDALKIAVKSDDVEVRRRAADILDKFKWGLYPDTPKEIADLIQTYRGGTKDDKDKTIKDLFALGNKGCAALLKIAKAEDDADYRQQLFQTISQESARVLPQLLAESNFSVLDELLDLTLAVRSDDRVLQYHAAYWLLRDKLDDRIAHFKKLAEKEQDNMHWQTLAFLYRAKGDREQLAKIMDKTSRHDLLQATLIAANDWKALSKLAEKTEGVTDVETLSLHLAFHRLAGNTDAYDRQMIELRKRAEDDAESRWLACKGILINSGPGAIVDLLPKSEQAVVGFQLLVTQMKYKEALEYADKVNDEQKPYITLMKARTLANLGETEKAREIFAEFALKLEKNKDEPWGEDLIKNELRGGLREQAMQHLGWLLSSVRAEGNEAPLLGLVYPQQRDQAAILWKAIRQRQPDETIADSLKKLGLALTGQLDADKLETLLADTAKKARDLPPSETEVWLLAVGETAFTANMDELGVKYLEQAARLDLSPMPHLKLGDHFASKKSWERAIESYRQACDKDPKQPLSMWLNGLALTRAGREKEGKKLMDLAHWLPLGDDNVRFFFCKDLLKRPSPESRAAVDREVDLAVRTGVPDSYFTSELLRLAGNVFAEKKEYLKAAELQERSLLRVLTPVTEFVEPYAYVTVPHYIHALRARGLVAADKMTDARREIEYCQSLLPGNVDLPIQVSRELDKHGHKKLADDIFTTSLTVNVNASRDYPKNAGQHNNLAWLCACCRRELDKGLEHALTAVKLAPDNAGYLDTLAEIHFQKGDKAKAIELMKKCLAMEPKRTYYRKQMKRFESGDRESEVPSAEDD